MQWFLEIISKEYVSLNSLINQYPSCFTLKENHTSNIEQNKLIYNKTEYSKLQLFTNKKLNTSKMQIKKECNISINVTKTYKK